MDDYCEVTCKMTKITGSEMLSLEWLLCEEYHSSNQWKVQSETPEERYLVFMNERKYFMR